MDARQSGYFGRDIVRVDSLGSEGDVGADQRPCRHFLLLDAPN
jgi:hypothetical protein